MQDDRLNFKVDFNKRIYTFALDIIAFIGHLPENRTSRIIGDQLLRSATSIGANIIEAKAASTRKDYTNFFNHALKSANESKYWLNLLKDSHIADGVKTEKLLCETNEISNILAPVLLR
jgi:four helix bundle protein